MHRQQQLRKISILSGLLFWFAPLRLTAQVVQVAPFGLPDAVVDLAARDSVQLVKGQWRYHNVKIVDADSRAVGPDLKPSGDPIKTYDYAPYAGAADFDDSQWEAIDAITLDQRRSTENHRSEEHTSELQSHSDLVCRLLLEKKNKQTI